MFHVTLLEQPANCAKPELLPIVDAAYASPTSDAAKYMRTELCPGCPCGTTCLALGMSQRETGIWGGATPARRTKHGAPGSPNTQYNRRHTPAA